MKRHIPTRRGLHASLIGGAWFFIVISLLHLAWVVAVKSDGAEGLVSLYQTDVEGEVYRAAGLAYDGVGGLVRAVMQAGVVIAAAVLSLGPWLRARRIGHGILVGWSLWWAGNLMWLAGMDGRLDSILQATLLTTFAGCTAYRAWRGWTPPRPTIPAPVIDVEAAAKLLEAGDDETLRAKAKRVAGNANRKITTYWTPERRAKVAGGAKAAGNTIGRGVAAGAKQTRDGVRKGVAYVKQRRQQQPAEA